MIIQNPNPTSFTDSKAIELIRDRTRGVAIGHTLGFYLYGRPGTGKSHVVKQTLDELNVKYRYQQGYVTAKGFFDLIAQNRDKLIVLDDVSSLFCDRTALQILLAALDNEKSKKGVREIVYRKHDEVKKVVFSGGMIAISNIGLGSGDQLRTALGSRVHTFHYDPSDACMESMMRDIASKGWTGKVGSLSAGECDEVTEFLIAESHRLEGRLDLRNLVDKAFPDFLQWRSGLTQLHWHDLILATLNDHAIEYDHVQMLSPKKQELRDETKLVKKLEEEIPDRLTRIAEFNRLTGKSQRCYYRALYRAKRT